jgi:hypothetical protein
MRRSRRLTALGIAAASAVVVSLAFQPGVATAKPNDPGQPGVAKGPTGDIRNVGPDYNNGKQLPFNKKSLAAARSDAQSQRATAAAAPAVGDVKLFPAMDDSTGSIYVKQYTLRGIGNHISVWVANDRRFPGSDCRNTLGLTNITTAQVKSFIGEFDNNIYPTESASFSVPPNRNGARAPLAPQIGEPANYYQVPASQADDTAVLVDNVRDANFYDPSTPDGQTYIAGFFYSVFNDFVNRNVMTIDAYDWLHRTGANPPDDRATQSYIDCANKQGQAGPYGGPRPHLYEGTFAHEYQHLLESYVDPDEVSWVNEGLSDYAQTLVGYVDPSLAPDNPAADSHIKSFLGYQGAAFGGPENSLTNWQDQGGPEILADYGAAYSFMEYLEGKYGPSFMEDLHHNPGNGLEGLQSVLTAHGSSKSAQDTLHDWAAAMALDNYIQKDPSYSPNGPFTVDTLQAKINFDTVQAFSTPGAPPNGSDYVRLRDSAGKYLSSKDLTNLSFQGSQTLPPAPVQWTTSVTPPSATADTTTCGSIPKGPTNRALYSGCGENLDRSIARQITVPAGSPSLTFDALWDTEDGWDFGFVQISDDGGKTWKSLPTTDTTTTHDPGAISGVVDNLPGFTGDSGSFKTQTADLSDYAGKKVLLGFRYITDSGVNEAGFWVRNIQVNGGTALPTALAGWKSYNQINPTAVHGYTVQLIGINAAGNVVHYKKLPLDSSFAGSISGAALKTALGSNSSTVAAIVMYDEPTESITQYARYQLTANGDLQPGG